MTGHIRAARCATFFIFVLAASAAASDHKPEPLAITMSARMAPARTDVVARMRVEPDARSRELTIEWVAEDLSGGSHAITLNGANAAATHRFTIKHMSPGSYIVTAILRLSDGSEIRRASSVTVVGIGGSETLGSGGAQGSAGGRLRPATRQ
jgi:hypothetical protein